MHRRYVRGCQEGLARTKASQARYTASRRNRQGDSPRCATCLGLIGWNHAGCVCAAGEG